MSLLKISCKLLIFCKINFSFLNSCLLNSPWQKEFNFLVYIYLPKQQIIYVYPTPENVNQIQYQDKADNCYGFSYKQISCPSNRKEIREYKYQ